MPSVPKRVLLLCGIVLAALVGLSFYMLHPAAPPAEDVVVRDVTESGGQRSFLVYVTGAVRRPGVYEMPRGSHLYDAVKAAGGELPYAAIADVDLTAPVTEDRKIHIPMGDKGTVAAAGLININTADAKALESLPGIGEVIAGRIIDYREEHGYFHTKEELLRVKSISRGKLEKFADKITL